MNRFIKSYKQLFSLLLGLLLHSSFYAVTFKNEPLTNFIQPGEVLCATFPENYLVIFDMESNNFDITQNGIEELGNLQEIFQKVMAGRSGCSVSSRTFDSSANTIDYNSSYLNGRESMDLHGRTSLQFIHCLLESPFISITGNKMKFVDSFLINPEVLNLNIGSPGSDYDTIQIVFYNQPENPTVIIGEIDLNNDQTKRLIVSNVKEIRMKFKWDKSLVLKSTPEGARAINQDSQPDNTCPQSKESLPANFSIASLLYMACCDMFQ